MSIRPLFVLALAAFPTALSIPAAIKRQDLITASTIIQDIQNIHAGVQSLDTHVTAYDGSLLSETPLIGDFAAIHLANRKGFADANLRQANFTAQESTDIVQAVIDTVGKSIPAAVKETKSKKPLFDQTDQAPIVLGTFKLLLNDHDTFSAAVSKHFTADEERGTAVVAKIHDAIQSGIDAFST